MSVTFDLLDDLPRGRLAIQASAGTGKTYALAALATRFIAEQDLDTSELLIVTFTRAATSELRARVRERLVDAAAHLAADPSPPVADELLVHLASADRELRLDRIRRAITEFDAATITTIHGFATQVLGTLGTTAGTDPDATLVDDSAELAAECCADVLAAASVEHAADVLPTHKALVTATRNAINIDDLVLAPSPGTDGVSPAATVLVELVSRSIEMMRVRRRGAGTMSFDDILVELRRAFDGDGGTAAIETLRKRFRVALIDEFQDTDPVQWDIFETLFDVDGERSLVLVGDPKQAIYAFRGADVQTYLGAVGSGAARRTLGTNWRSDGAVLTATDALLNGATFGSPEIGFAPVAPAPQHEERRLTDLHGTPLPALELRLVSGEGRETSKAGDLKVKVAKKAIMSDMVSRIRGLLTDGRIPLSTEAATESGERVRPVQPSDIAVLVLTGEEADDVKTALTAQGIPAVLARGDSVLESPAADQWRWLLEALLRPSDLSRARTFALSWFCGRSAQWVHDAPDAELAALQEQLHDWSETLLEHGVIDFVHRVRTESGVVARVLARPDGDRCMTDVDHVAELLQSAAPAGRSSVAGLLSVLDAPPPITIEADIDRDVVSRRVESEAAAVQVMTVWVSKGLEFPIVCCPTLWRQSKVTPIYRDPVTGARAYDLSASEPWPDKAQAAIRSRLVDAEDAGERLRLLYVAMTRAKHQTMVWWARYNLGAGSPLARVLFGRTEGVIDPDLYMARKVPLPADADLLEAVVPIAAAAGDTMHVSLVEDAEPGDPWSDPTAAATLPELCAARLERPLDRSAHRWSFTAITSRSTAHENPFDTSGGDAGASDEDHQGDDDLDRPLVDGSLGTERSAAPGSLAMLPAGATFGTLVHSVLEEIDFTSEQLDADLTVEVERQLQWRTMDLTPRGVDGPVDDAAGRALLVAGLREAIETPLGAIADGRRLRDIPASDRLDEMSFELLLGSDQRRPSVRQIGRLVLQHVPAGGLFGPEPLHDWATRLADGELPVSLDGHLTGSIDLVLRVRDGAGRARYVVVDYKTNRLGERGRPPGPDEYRPDRLAVAMNDHHYPLQALLYSVALHRYLRWRVPDYDPRTDLGGSAYLFLRGMTGAQVATVDGEPHGVFAWRTPPALVTALSDLLDGRRVTGVGS
ncbi:MAG: UvrD-helicase domain-containing protein [Actinomycetota bacterium]|nr:UvrD-helicase domain-containing protein [Actinomycetota bacterium]